MGIRAFLFIVPLLGLLGCGPSLRMVHESTVYFERCHAAELDDAIPIETRTECWERWLRWYTAEQTQTRILYARERIVYLSQGEIADPLPSEDSAGSEDAEPAPTGSTTEIAAGPAIASPARERSRRQPRTSGHEICQPVCMPGWNACVDRCVDNERTCIAACQTEYGACMSGCL